MGKLDVQSTVTLVLNGEQAKTSLRDITRAVNAVRAEVALMNEADNPELYRKRVAELQRLTAAQRDHRNAIAGVVEEQKGFFSDFLQGFGEINALSGNVALGTVLGGWIKDAASAIGSLLSSVVETYSTFEKFDAVLTNTLGSSSASKKALDMLQKFAAETPFSLEELTGSFVKLANRGIIPTTSELRKMGDLAASQGKSFDELTEAVLDAMTGEFERLKEFGVRASKNGDTVKLSFKGVTKEVENTEEAIQNAVLSLGEMEGVAGGMQKMSERIGGVMSNMGDNIDRIFNRIGQSIGETLFTAFSMVNDLLGALGDTRTQAERLTDAYNEQKQSVANLDKNTEPLIQRYEELRAKGSLNKDEQIELKSVIGQIAQVIPTAVTEWDKYGNALGVNTEKARDYIKVQKALLEYQNKAAIEATKSEILAAQRNQRALQRTLNSGEVSASGGGMASNQVRKMTKEEYAETIVNIKKVSDDIEAKTTLLRGLTGAYMDEAAKKTGGPEKVVAIADMTIGELQAKLQKLNKALQDTKIGTKGYKDLMVEINDVEKILSQAKSDKNQQGQENKWQRERKQTVDGLAALAKEYQEFEAAHLYEMASAHQKEVDAIADKYHKEIEKQKAGLQKKHINAKEAAEINERLEALGAEKNRAVEATKVRQAKETTDAITQFNQKLSHRLETERQKEEDSINNFYNDRKEKAGTNADELAAIETGRAEALAQAKINEEKRFQDEKDKIQSDGLLLAGDKDAIELARINKKYDDQIEALKSKFTKEKQLTDEFQELVGQVNENREADKQQAAAAKKKEEKKKLRDAAIDAADDIAKAVFSIGTRNRQAETDKQLKDLDRKKEAELSNKNLTEAQKDAINQKYAKQEAAIKKKAWEAQKAADLQAAVVAGALAVVKALPNYVLAAAAAVTTGIQIATISSAKAPEFKKGGTLIPKGPSHADGGINLVNNQTGEVIGEMEGDEPITIFSKETYRNNKMLINELLYNSQNRNGAPVSINTGYATRPAASVYQNGGVIPGRSYAQGSGSSGAGDNSRLAELEGKLLALTDLVAAEAAKPVEINYHYFRRENAKYVAIENSAKG